MHIIQGQKKTNKKEIQSSGREIWIIPNKLTPDRTFFFTAYLMDYIKQISAITFRFATQNSFPAWPGHHFKLFRAMPGLNITHC